MHQCHHSAHMCTSCKEEECAHTKYTAFALVKFLSWSTLICTFKLVELCVLVTVALDLGSLKSYAPYDLYNKYHTHMGTHTFIPFYIYSRTLTLSLAHSLTHSTHSHSLHSLTHSHTLTHSLAHWLTHSHSLTHSLTHSHTLTLTASLPHQLTHCLTASLPHCLTASLNRRLNDSFTDSHTLTYWFTD